MFIEVQPLVGFHKKLTYQASPAFNIVKGDIVKIPLRNQTTYGYVTGINIEPIQGNMIIKSVIASYGVTTDLYYDKFITRLAHYHLIDPRHLYAKIAYTFIQPLSNEAALSPDHTISDARAKEDITLTSEQQAAVNAITMHINDQRYESFLLQGVTGSGKTWVYIACIEHALRLNKSALILVPEIALVLALHDRVAAYFESAWPVYALHSGMNSKQRADTIAHLAEQKTGIIIGVQIPILLRIHNLGIIIVDEEHEASYQTNNSPYINVRDAAILRAHTYNIPIILGSATPSIATWHAAKIGKIKHLILSTRFNGSLPDIEIVSLEKPVKQRPWWLSAELDQGIQDALQNQKQTLLFLNRRGFSSSVECRLCKQCLMCTACSVTLTYHEDNQVRCHYCGSTSLLPNNCVNCGPKGTFYKRGLGTQQVVSLVKSRYPSARVERADLDVTSNKKKWMSILNRMHAGEIDILVGTQTITKGHHFPAVDLVGVLWADSGLHFPSYQNCEHTMQQLLQVAGRAGRSSKKSRVIIQTINSHPLFNQLHETEYDAFCVQECEFRQLAQYPPFYKFSCLVIRGIDEVQVKQMAHDIAHDLKRIIAENHQTETILVQGPAPALTYKVKNKYTLHIFLKAIAYSDITKIVRPFFAQQFDEKNKNIELLFMPALRQ